MLENMESLYRWAPLVSIGIFFLGVLVGWICAKRTLSSRVVTEDEVEREAL